MKFVDKSQLLLILLLCGASPVAYARTGWQLPSDVGSAFANSVLYFNESVLITGRLYANSMLLEEEPQCFLLELKSDYSYDLQKLPSDGFVEACMDIQTLNNHVALLGYSERPELLARLPTSTTTNEVSSTLVAGMLLDLDGIKLSDSIAGSTIVGDSSSRSILPVSFATAQIPLGDAVYAVSRDTDDISGTFPYKNYRLTFHRFQRTRVGFENQQVESFHRSYSTFYNDSIASIMASKLLYLGDDLAVVVGSTSGQGLIFGYKTFGNDNDVDGFLVKLNVTTGLSYGSANDIVRIESIDRSDDYIHDSCHHNDNLFVVGTFMGNGTTTPKAFLSQLDVQTLNIQWTIQIEGEGKSCAVTPDGNDIWVAGTVEQDVFVAKATAVGDLAFTRRMGTSSADELVDLTTDKDGNAVVVVNTDGSWLRQRSATETASDIVVLTVTRDAGDYVVALDKQPLAPAPIDPTSSTSSVPITRTTPPPSNLRPTTAAPTAAQITSATTTIPAPTSITSTVSPTSAPSNIAGLASGLGLNSRHNLFSVASLAWLTCLPLFLL